MEPGVFRPRVTPGLKTRGSISNYARDLLISSVNGLRLVRQIILQHVLAERVWRREVGLAAGFAFLRAAPLKDSAEAVLANESRV